MDGIFLGGCSTDRQTDQFLGFGVFARRDGVTMSPGENLLGVLPLQLRDLCWISAKVMAHSSDGEMHLVKKTVSNREIREQIAAAGMSYFYPARILAYLETAKICRSCRLNAKMRLQDS